MKLIRTVKAFQKTYKSLLLEMIRTDFKLRYQGSVLGYLWSLLKPLMLFAILYTVFTKFLHIGRGVPNYPISLLLGIVMWNFFTEATTNALSSIVSKGSLIRKINIPRYLIPVAAISSAFINMSLNLVVVFIFVLFAHDTALSWFTIIAFPILLAELVVVSVSTGFFLSALYVRYRDIEHIWDILKQAMFYTIPILYPLSLIDSVPLQKLIISNPLAQIIQDSRAVITHRGNLQTGDIFHNPLARLIPFALVVIALLISSAYFRKRSKYFAEEI